jgi:hypothetical protein
MSGGDVTPFTAMSWDAQVAWSRAQWPAWYAAAERDWAEPGRRSVYWE